MDYLSWNNCLASHFFKPELAGRRVFLFATEELISALGKKSDVGLRDYINAILSGPNWAIRPGVCHKAYDTFDGWRDRRLQFPPYIGYLCLFVLAAGHEGDFSPISYYPRLREIVGEQPDTGAFPFFDRMLELWDDLEHWTVEDQLGQLGIFRAYIQGKKIHIGLPLSQTFLTQQELNKLPIIFAASGFDPTDIPSDLELLAATLTHGRSHFRNSTLKLLDPTRRLNNDLRATFAETIRSELIDWDGYIPPSDRTNSTSSRYIPLVICCERLDIVAKRAEFAFRCKTANGITDDGLYLCENTNSKPTIFCGPATFPWSTPLVDDAGIKIDAKYYEWLTGVTLTDSAASQTCKLVGRPVYVLIPGESKGLPGFIGINRLNRNQLVYLLVHKSVLAQITRWGAESCIGFEDLGIRSGLPDDWTMFKINSILNDAGIATDYPSLALPITVRLTLEDGVRVARGNHFFIFSPPKIHIEGIEGQGEIFVDGLHISTIIGDGYFQIPFSIRNEGQHIVEVKFETEIVKARFSLVKNFDWRLSKPVEKFDSFGCLVNSSSNYFPGIAGAFAEIKELPNFSFNTFLEVAEYPRVLFLGREPGQVIDWPKEELPDSWSPIWAIPMRRKGHVIFCGASIAISKPATCVSTTQKFRRRWKEIVWHKRRRIMPPAHPLLRILWDEYQNVARKL